MALLNRSDFAGIGDIANHCDLNKLNIAINEAAEFDMDVIYCNFWSDVITNWENEDDEWRLLIDGGDYQGCRGTRTHQGIKRIWAYFAYARYVMINGFNDTPSGMVAKTNQFSIPTPLKELQAYSDKYRNMAKTLVDKSNSYLCLNSSYFINFNTYECAPCGCNGECGVDGLNTKGYGIKSSIIRKKI